jgi:hypothetical protein
MYAIHEFSRPALCPDMYAIHEFSSPALCPDMYAIHEFSCLRITFLYSFPCPPMQYKSLQKTCIYAGRFTMQVISSTSQSSKKKWPFKNTRKGITKGLKSNKESELQPVTPIGFFQIRSAQTRMMGTNTEQIFQAIVSADVKKICHTIFRGNKTNRKSNYSRQHRSAEGQTLVFFTTY